MLGVGRARRGRRGASYACWRPEIVAAGVATTTGGVDAAAQLGSDRSRGSQWPARLVSEIANLQMDDVVVGVSRPHLRLRTGTTKGGRSRRIPLWWDAGTLEELAAWKVERKKHGAVAADPFVCS